MRAPNSRVRVCIMRSLIDWWCAHTMDVESKRCFILDTINNDIDYYSGYYSSHFRVRMHYVLGIVCVRAPNSRVCMCVCACVCVCVLCFIN